MNSTKKSFKKTPLSYNIILLFFRGTPTFSAQWLYQDLQEQESSFTQYQGKIIDSGNKTHWSCKPYDLKTQYKYR